MTGEAPRTEAGRRVSRRGFLGVAAGAAAAGTGAVAATRLIAAPASPGIPHPSLAAVASTAGGLASSHCVDAAAALVPVNPGNPDGILVPPPPLPASPGRVRHFELVLTEVQIEVARGRMLTAWAFNGGVPGPTIRVTQGDVVEVLFRNRGRLPHTIHFHGIHASAVDGVDQVVNPGADLTYRFEAQPVGLFVYHCHMAPIADHLNHGMYGTFIIDPPSPRPPARELVFVMNGYSFGKDGSDTRTNEFYSVNGPAGYYACNPIPLKSGELVRAYVTNMTEFDPLNSFHLHANVFKQIPSVKALDSNVWDDTVALCQGQRAILEFQYDLPGKYMFHAHQSDIAAKGWSGFFQVS